MKWLLAGDAHGNRRYLRRVMEMAVEERAVGVIQLGDFGFWPSAGRFVADQRQLASRLGLTLWVVAGNHDYPGTGRRDDGGFRSYETDDPQLNDLCVLARGTVIDIEGVRVGALGGAISVDRGKRTALADYWPDEAVTEEDVEVASASGPVSVWLTHDAVDLPSGFRSTTFDEHLDHDLSKQRARMKQVFAALRPRLHVHGHLHHRYSAATEFGSVLGLAHEDVDSGCYVVDLANYRRNA